MYLLSQDKKNLMKFERLEISKLFKTYSITAHGIGQYNSIEVGTYETEDQAKVEFNRIMEALRSGQTTIYEVR